MNPAYELNRMGKEGWSVAGCRRAITERQQGIYECVMQRPLAGGSRPKPGGAGDALRRAVEVE